MSRGESGPEGGGGTKLPTDQRDERSLADLTMQLSEQAATLARRSRRGLRL